jgi:ketosteroid isomerase-like protein
MTESAASSDPVLAANRRLVIDHFEDFVNRRDLGAVDRNLTTDFLDHDGPGGKPAGRAAEKALMSGLHDLFPDLHVEVKDCIAQDDKVVVRNLWTGTNARTGQRMEFHGFVLWRIADGNIAERWATVTPLNEITQQALDW